MIGTDPRLKSVLARLAERPSIDTSPLVSQTRRLARDIPQVRLSSTRMEEQRLLLSANRSRLVGIKFDCLAEHQYLSSARSQIEDYLYGKYANFLGGVKNDRGRKAMLNTALAPFDRRIDSLRRVIDLVELVMADYDSRGFAFRDVVAASRRGERDQ